MALQIHYPSSITRKPYSLLQFNHYPTKAHFTIKSQKASEPPKPDVEVGETTASSKKAGSPGQGFGSSSSSSAPTKDNVKSVTGKKKGRSRRERASIIRRTPVEKPSFASSLEDEAKAKERGRNESAFLLAWLALGGIIFFQGIALAASGFLPEEWDRFFVKYLYPSFTPTVALFVAGTVAYGVIKYLQNEELNTKK